MEYLFIGGGNMGYALAAALIGKGVCQPGSIAVADPLPDARGRVAKLGCVALESPGHANARVIVLAVKPQQAAEAMHNLAGKLTARQVVVSIMAGVRIAAIRAATGHAAIVRVMPNTPAQVGLGMNVYHAASGVTAEQLAPVDAMLQASGKALSVTSEDLIDAATAVSGSGPAYVYYVAEHWMRAAEAMGFSGHDAELLVQQTLRGATELWQVSGASPATLRQQVTSKGGTTAAAIESMDAAGTGRAIETGVRRAYERAKELGR